MVTQLSPIILSSALGAFGIFYLIAGVTALLTVYVLLLIPETKVRECSLYKILHHSCVFVCIYIRMCVCVHVCVSVCMHYVCVSRVCVYASVYVCECMHALCVCITRVCVCICVRV